MRTKIKVLTYCVLAAVALTLGCGGKVGEYPDAARPGIAVITAPDGSLSSPTDTSIKEIQLLISPEYNPDTNKLNLYLLLYDQDGNELPSSIVNKYNFSVMTNAGVGARPVDIANGTTSFTRVTGVTDHTVALGMDTSGSMTYVDPETGKSSNQSAIDAATLYVDEMLDSDRAGIVEFNTNATVLQPITKDRELLYDAIRKLGAEGATNIGDAIKKSVETVGAYPGKTAAVIMTDGGDTEGLIDEGITLAVERGIPVFTVGLGAGVSPYELVRIAQATGGQYFEASGVDLADVFANTIPAAIAQLPPRDANLLSFVPDLAVPEEFDSMYITITATLTFENARKVHRAIATGTCIIAGSR